MGEKSFFKFIGSSGNKRLRFKICTQRGKITEFMVQLELYVGNKWKPVVRYDNSHDFPHRDILDRNGKLVEKKRLRLETLKEILEYAEQDLSDRVEWYVEKFLKTRGA